MHGADEADDDEGELAACDECGPGPESAAAADLVPGGGVVAGDQFRRGRDRGQHKGGGQERQEVVGVDGQTDGEEEHGGEQVPQWAEHGTGSVGGLASESESDKEGSDCRGGVDEFGQRGDHQGQAEDPQQELFVVGVGEQPAEVVAPPVGGGERGEDRADCDQDAEDGLPPGPPEARTASRGR